MEGDDKLQRGKEGVMGKDENTLWESNGQYGGRISGYGKETEITRGTEYEMGKRRGQQAKTIIIQLRRM